MGDHAFPALLGFGLELTQATTVPELERIFLERAPALLDMPLAGLYLNDASGTRPERMAAVNVSDRFLYRYEEAWRAIDPVYGRVVAQRMPVRNLDLFSFDDWVRSDLFRDLHRMHAIIYNVHGPIVVEGKLAGSVAFARDDSRCPPGRAEREAIAHICQIMSVALANVRRAERMERRVADLVAAMDLHARPLAITTRDDPTPFLNRPARELVEQLDGEAELIYSLAVRTTTRGETAHELDVKLAGGGIARLRGRSRRPRHDESTVITALELTGPGLPPAPRSDPAEGAPLLTPREREVSRLLAEGRTDAEIAAILFLSPHTVKAHVKRVYQKVGVRSRVELTRRVMTGDLAT